jgi:hypothetical protein
MFDILAFRFLFISNMDLMAVMNGYIFQVLKPITRKKLKIEGEMYKKALSEYLETLPSYIGGKCTCTKCSTMSIGYMQQPPTNWMNRIDPSAVVTDGEDPRARHLVDEIDINLNGNCDQVLRTAIISILMLWVFIAVVAGLFDPGSRPFFASWKSE